MGRVTAIVVKLDNGKYRRLNLRKIKSIYTDAAYICAGTMESGEGGVAGPETEQPDFAPTAESADASSPGLAASGEDGDAGPECFLINGVWVCT